MTTSTSKNFRVTHSSRHRKIFLLVVVVIVSIVNISERMHDPGYHGESLGLDIFKLSIIINDSTNISSVRSSYLCCT